MKLIGAEPLTRPLGDSWLHGALVAAIVFCVSTYLISSFRASLNPENTFEWLDPKRIVLIASGAGVFWLAIRAAARRLADARGLVRILMVVLPGMAALFGLAVGWDMLVERRFDNVAARNLRWILLWTGYFGTGLAAWLAVQYGAALAMAQAQQDGGPTSLAEETGTDRSVPEGFWVKTGRQAVRIAHDDIEWIEAEGNYVRIHSRDAAHGLVRMSLAGLAAELDGEQFIRIHRSALCRRSAIKGYRRKPSGAMLVRLASGVEAPLGRSYAKALIERSGSLEPTVAFAGNDTVSSELRDAQAG